MTRKKKEGAPPPTGIVLQSAVDEETGQPMATGAGAWYDVVPVGIDPSGDTAQNLYREQLRSDWNSAIEDRQRAEKFEQELAMRSAMYVPHSVGEVLLAGFAADDIRTRDREQSERRAEARRAAASQYDSNLDVSRLGIARAQRERRERLENAPASLADLDDVRRHQKAMSAKLEAVRVRARQPSFNPT